MRRYKIFIIKNIFARGKPPAKNTIVRFLKAKTALRQKWIKMCIRSILIPIRASNAKLKVLSIKYLMKIKIFSIRHLKPNRKFALLGIRRGLNTLNHLETLKLLWPIFIKLKRRLLFHKKTKKVRFSILLSVKNRFIKM